MLKDLPKLLLTVFLTEIVRRYVPVLLPYALFVISTWITYKVVTTKMLKPKVERTFERFGPLPIALMAILLLFACWRTSKVVAGLLPLASGPTTVAGDTNNNTVNGTNNGFVGQNYGNITINPGTDSSHTTLRAENVNQERVEDGSFLTTAVFILDTPFPVGNLYIEVHGRSISGLEVSPMRSGISITGMSANRGGYSFTNIQNAFGRYAVRITSKKAEQFQVDYKPE